MVRGINFQFLMARYKNKLDHTVLEYLCFNRVKIIETIRAASRKRQLMRTTRVKVI